jgi:cell division protein FtsB
MEFAVLIPIVSILATAWVIVASVRARHQHKAGSGNVTPMSVGEARENVQLARENEDLKLTIERLEDRLGVLERIATDPAERTAREIESLR